MAVYKVSCLGFGVQGLGVKAFGLGFTSLGRESRCRGVFFFVEGCGLRQRGWGYYL